MIGKGHQIIFINGPRRSGKDTAANHIMKEFINVRHKKFAGCMKAGMREVFGLTNQQWKDLEQVPSGDYKLQPQSNLFGMSWVEVLIWFSEECMKPKFGPWVFGELMTEQLKIPTAAPLTVISDCRFMTEVQPVIDYFGPQNCHVFRLYREGCTFNGDTGAYGDPTQLPGDVTWWDIENEYELDMYRRQILRRTNKILGLERTYD